MKHIMLAAALLAIAGTASAEGNHGKAGHQHRTEAYQQGEAKAAPQAKVSKTVAAKADTKRLPGRDCKLYEGGVRQHAFPQYEIGNPDRPECPAA